MNKWDYYSLRKMKEIVLRRVFHKSIVNYAGRKIIAAESANELIGEMIRSDKPFAVSRFGSTELSVLLSREVCKYHRLYRNNDKNLCMLSGFFPDDKHLIDQFCEMMLHEIAQIDLLGVWFSSLEEYIVGEYMHDTKLTYLTAVEPYIYKNPWSKMLEGKKVLVVHPFEESILKQYFRREKLFKDSNVLPQFELKTLKAVQTIAGEKDERFATWFDALGYMKDEIKKIDFDIAIIGCGAYGMPLTIEIKKMGRKAVHMGGATQILFGIKGARWDENPTISGMYNEYWIRPGKNEQCKDSSAVEGGCYW